MSLGPALVPSVGFALRNGLRSNLFPYELMSSGRESMPLSHNPTKSKAYSSLVRLSHILKPQCITVPGDDGSNW